MPGGDCHIAFVVCWLPRAFYYLFYLFDRPDLVTLLLRKLSVTFLLFQSSTNPFIYSFYRREFRQAVKILIKCQWVNRSASSFIKRLRHRAISVNCLCVKCSETIKKSYFEWLWIMKKATLNDYAFCKSRFPNSCNILWNKMFQH